MSQFKCIGFGFCGSVWSPSTSSESEVSCDAYKREDGGPGRSLSNDYEIHQHIIAEMNNHTRAKNQASPELSQLVAITHVFEFIRPKDSWWIGNMQRFPTNFSPCNTIHAERIPPFPTTIRHLLIDTYCPKELVESVKQSGPNRDCMIRPYLGKRRHHRTQSKFRAFSLRNFPLHLDQLEELVSEADIHTYARLMGKALAMLHWLAKVDANDVEFVLAPPRDEMRPAINNVLGRHVLWILDFDCCRPITFDTVGAERAAQSFMGNDPFFPRQTQGSSLWNSFKEAYLQDAMAFCREGMEAGLPQLVMDRIQTACEEKAMSRIDRTIDTYADGETQYQREGTGKASR